MTANTKQSDKVQNALDEARTLILGTQVLLGVQFQSTLQPAFARLPIDLQKTSIASLMLLNISLALLLFPGSFHRIVEQEQDSLRQHRITSLSVTAALLFVGLRLSIDIAIATFILTGPVIAWLVGGASLAVAFALWYGWEATMRARDGKSTRVIAERHPRENDEVMDETDLATRVKQAFTEVRVVLPGAQTLLGFQFLSIFAPAFEQLPPESRLIHLASLGATALATVLLIAPAAFHRIVEDGNDTERVQSVAGACMIGALILLPLGLAGDIYVVVLKVLVSWVWGVLAGAASLLMCYALWFGVTTLARHFWQAPRIRGKTA